jgi:hypothetical protein
LIVQDGSGGFLESITNLRPRVQRRFGRQPSTEMALYISLPEALACCRRFALMGNSIIRFQNTLSNEVEEFDEAKLVDFGTSFEAAHGTIRVSDRFSFNG